jgi:hypothetical protein
MPGDQRSVKVERCERCSRQVVIGKFATDLRVLAGIRAATASGKVIDSRTAVMLMPMNFSV